MASPSAQSEHDKSQSKKAAASGWIGSALEYYDFFIYATAASLVFPQIFFPSENPTVAIVASLATYGVGYVARPIGAFFLGTLGRHPWPENRADPLHVPDGHLHDAGRSPAHISAGRHAGAGASCYLAPRPGLRGRRRNIRGQFNDPGTCSIWPARILCELYAARRTGRANSCGGSFPATGSLHA